LQSETPENNENKITSEANNIGIFSPYMTLGDMKSLNIPRERGMTRSTGGLTDHI